MVINRAADGGAAAQKGFRYQTLCALAYYFRFPNAKIQLEGSEDFDLIVPGGSPIRYQAKSRRSLSLSAIIKTYLPRVASRLSSGDEEILLLESEPGPELKGALLGEQEHFESVLDKMTGDRQKYLDENSKRWTREKALKTLKRVQYKVQPTNLLYDELIERMKENSLTGEPEMTVDLFLSWLSHGSETSEVFEPGSLQEKLLAIGQYLVHLEDKKTELGRTVRPLEVDSTCNLVQNRALLMEEFQAGVSARFEHIVNNLDFEREALLDVIANGFQANQTVVLKGLSGQGKSTLAYRFLHRNTRRALRFQVYPDSNYASFFAIYNTLAGYAKCFGHPIYCLLDVAPGDTAWTEFVTQLQSNALLRILVCIREEDWNRAQFRGTYLPPFIVDLSFEKTEAKELYSRYSNAQVEPTFPCFQDAWEIFGEGGPLLEFVYLLREGQTLRGRLVSQLASLSSDHKHLLRQVCVADICGAKFLPKLLWGGRELQELVSLLEREHLVFQSEDEEWLIGAHPVRSRIISEILHEKFISIEETAFEILSAVDEVGLEELLLYLLLNFPNRRGELLQRLNQYQPTTWIGAGSVLRALLWIGLKVSLEANEELLSEMWEEHHGTTDLILHSVLDAGRLKENWPELVQPFWQKLDTPKESLYESYSDRWAHRDFIYNEAKDWLSRFDPSRLPAPNCIASWESLCWCAHWRKTLLTDGIGRMVEQIPQVWDSHLPLRLGIELHRCLSHQPKTKKLDSLHSVLLDRFRRERSAFLVAPSSKAVLCRALVPKDPRKRDGEPAEIASLLIGLFPDVETISLAWYGKADGSEKAYNFERRDIKSHFLPERRAVILNVWAAGLLRLSRRPPSWVNYVRDVYEGRVAYLEGLRLFNGIFADHYTTKADEGNLRVSLNVGPWTEKSELDFGQLMPLETLGEPFGRFHEGISNVHLSQLGVQTPLTRYTRYFRLLRDFQTSTCNVFRQLPCALRILPARDYVGRVPKKQAEYQEFLSELAAIGWDESFAELAWRNFSDLIERRRLFLDDYDTRFEKFLRDQSYSELLENEEEELVALISNISVYADTPNRCLQDSEDVEHYGPNLLVSLRKELKKLIKGEPGLNEIIGAVRIDEGVDDIGFSTLFVQYDLSNPMFAGGAVAEALLCVIRRSIKREPESPVDFLPSMFWPRLGLVETYRGRLVEPTFHSIPTRFRIERNLSTKELPAEFELKSVPESLDIYKRQPNWSRRLTRGAVMLETWDQMILELAELCSLEKIPDLEDDETAADIIREWTTQAEVFFTSAAEEFISCLLPFVEDMSGAVEAQATPLGQQELGELHLGCLKSKELLDALAETAGELGKSKSPRDRSKTLQALRKRRAEVSLIRGTWSKFVLIGKIR